MLCRNTVDNYDKQHSGNSSYILQRELTLVPKHKSPLSLPLEAHEGKSIINAVIKDDTLVCYVIKYDYT